MSAIIHILKKRLYANNETIYYNSKALNHSNISSCKHL